MSGRSDVQVIAEALWRYEKALKDVDPPEFRDSMAVSVADLLPDAEAVVAGLRSAGRVVVDAEDLRAAHDALALLSSQHDPLLARLRSVLGEDA